MYYNNSNRKEDDDDLKFIPLNIKEPFAEKDSSWFPIVNMNSPNISSMTNNFILGFSSPKNGEKLDIGLQYRDRLCKKMGMKLTSTRCRADACFLFLPSRKR